MADSLNDTREKVLAAYREKAESLFATYETGRVAHCSEWLHHLKKPPATLLDIGSGSGRDAAYYAQQGYTVTAVEPTEQLRALAQEKYGHLNIRWIDDLLPELSVLRSQKQLFDHIHMNAVIFHLPLENTKDVLRSVRDLLTENGTFYVSLRKGPADPERRMFDVTKEHILTQAEGLFTLMDAVYDVPDYKRDNICWDRFLFRAL